jgi:hypothetical protein
MCMLDRPVEIWKETISKFDYRFRKWCLYNFDNLKPGMIVRFDHNDDLIYRVISYPFLSAKYSPDPNIPVGTIYNTEFLCFPENE